MTPKEKTLDYEPPLLTSYPHVASLCAMLGNNPWLMPEMVNELVGLVYDREIDRIDFSISLDILSYMKNYPLMYTHAVSRSFVQKNWRRFSEFVEAAIADGYYVHCLLDTFYVSAYRETYQREHYLHNAMIYGYSRQDRTMLFADAFEKGKYESRIVSYAEIDSAILSSHVGDWLDGILLCKRKEDPFSPVAYHTDYIKKQFEIFRDGAIPACSCAAEMRRREICETRFVHGIRVYDELADYVRKSIGPDGRFEAADLRLFYALQDHMEAWKYLAEQLMQRNQITHADFIIAKCSRLLERLKNLVLLAVKFNVTGKPGLSEKMADELIGCRDEAENVCRLFEEYMSPDFSEVEKERFHLTKPEYMSADSILVRRSRDEVWKRRKADQDVSFCAEAEASLTFQFFGEGLNLSVEKNPSYGKADVWIDGRMMKTIDFSDGESEERVEGLKSGYHSCQIRKREGDGKYINLREISVLNAQREIKNPGKEEGENCLSDEGCCPKTWEEPETSVYRVAYGKADGDIALVYGRAGYDIIGVRRKIPDDMTDANLTYVNALPVILMHTTAGKRGVRRSAEKKEYAAAYLLGEEFFEVYLTVPGKEKLVTLYFTDYDGLARSMEIAVTGTGGHVYDTCLVEEFTAGKMLQYRICGSVVFRFTRISGPDAVLSAVLLDDIG